MRKFLLAAGIFSVFSINAQAADGYYYGEPQPQYYEEVPHEVRYVDSSYNYVEVARPTPQQPRQVRYIEQPRHVRYVEQPSQVRYVEEPRYQRVSPSEQARYHERKVIRDEYNNSARQSYHDKAETKYYIGADVATISADFSEPDIKDYAEDSYNAISLVAGAKFNKHFGAELFYQKSGEEEKMYEDYDYEEGFETSYSAFGADLIGYLPVSQEFELLASLGLAHYDFDIKYKYYDYVYDYSETEDVSETSLGYRLGLGAQYNINKNFALRGMFRYVKLADDDKVGIKSLTELSLGLRYMF